MSEAQGANPVVTRALMGMTVVTGLVDAVSFLSLGRVFTANMTGNVVLLGFAAARLSAEPHQLHAMIVLTSLAMGARNAGVRKLAIPDLTTTVLTLTITGLAADSSLAGGSNPRWQRRTASVLALLAGAAMGAILVERSVFLA